MCPFSIVNISDTIWTTDLEWLAPNNDRFVVQSFFTSSSAAGNPLLQEVSLSNIDIFWNCKSRISFQYKANISPLSFPHQNKTDQHKINSVAVQLFYFLTPPPIHTLNLLTQHLLTQHNYLKSIYKQHSIAEIMTLNAESVSH